MSKKIKNDTKQIYVKYSFKLFMDKPLKHCVQIKIKFKSPLNSDLSLVIMNIIQK